MIPSAQSIILGTSTIVSDGNNGLIINGINLTGNITGGGGSTTTGQLTGVFYPLNQNPNNYLSSGNLTFNNLNDNSGIFMTGGCFTMTENLPVIISNYISGSSFNGAGYVRVVGKYAYLAVDPIAWSYSPDTHPPISYFNIIDIHNPTNPEIVGSLSTPQISGCEGIRIVGDYAYLCSYASNSLTIVDISNPSSPSQVGYVNHNTYLNQAQSSDVHGNYAYVCTVSAINSSQPDYLTVVDISNPYYPFIIGTTGSTQISYTTDIQVKGKYAYVASYFKSSFSTIDVSNPSTPTIVGQSATLPQPPSALYIDNKYAYVTCAGTGFYIVDISNPKSSSMPIVGSWFGANIWAINLVQNNLAYITDYIDNQIYIVNVSNPTSPYLINTINDAANLQHVDTTTAVGNYLYCARSAQNTGGLTIVKTAGIDVPGANIGSLCADEIYINNRLHVGSTIVGHTSIEAGPLGIYSQGALSVLGSGNFLSGISVSGASNFITSLSVNNNSVITSNQTGVFVVTGNTGTFVTTTASGLLTNVFYPLNTNPSNYITHNQTGNFSVITGTNYFSGNSFTLGNDIVTGNISGQIFSGTNFFIGSNSVVTSNQTGNFGNIIMGSGTGNLVAGTGISFTVINNTGLQINTLFGNQFNTGLQLGVRLSSINTYQNILSGNVGPGTWLVMAEVGAFSIGDFCNITAKLFSGIGAFFAEEFSIPLSGTTLTVTGFASASLNGLITTTANSTPITLACASNLVSAISPVIMSSPFNNAVGIPSGTSTFINMVRLY